MSIVDGEVVYLTYLDTEMCALLGDYFVSDVHVQIGPSLQKTVSFSSQQEESEG